MKKKKNVEFTPVFVIYIHRKNHLVTRDVISKYQLKTKDSVSPTYKSSKTRRVIRSTFGLRNHQRIRLTSINRE